MRSRTSRSRREMTSSLTTAAMPLLSWADAASGVPTSMVSRTNAMGWRTIDFAFRRGNRPGGRAYAVGRVIQNAVPPDNDVARWGDSRDAGRALQNLVPKAPRYLKPKRTITVVPTLAWLSLKLLRVSVAVASKHSSA